MRFLTAVLAALLLTSCFPGRPARPAIHQVPRKVAAPHRKVSPPPPSVPIEMPRVTSQTLSGITFDGVAFDSRSHRLLVVDQPNGPSSRYADSASAARSLGGLAATNAGFFTPEGKPLGLVAAAGKISGAWNSASSLGSGVWHETASGSVAITRRENLGRAGASAMRELIQAGPLLVENSRAVRGLEATKSSARTVILWDGGTRWWLGRGSPCTLAALGQALVTGQAAGWPVRQALNLDGGRSTDLWVSDRIAGGPVLIRPPWNRPVRNFLVLVTK